MPMAPSSTVKGMAGVEETETLGKRDPDRRQNLHGSWDDVPGLTIN
jgi:hypothetical protein